MGEGASLLPQDLTPSPPGSEDASYIWLCLVLATCDFSKVILFKGANLNTETELPTVAHAPQFQHRKYRKGDLEFEASFSSIASWRAA